MDSVTFKKVLDNINKLNERIKLLEFNNKELGEICEKHMLTIENLKVSLVDIVFRVKRVRNILQTRPLVGQQFILSTTDQEYLLEKMKKLEHAEFEFQEKCVQHGLHPAISIKDTKK